MNPTDAKNPEQEALWNGAAGRAWVEAQELLDRLFKPFEELLVREVRAATAQRVLDVGCGAGGTTVAIARHLGEKGHCVGVDISEPLIAAARTRAEREGAPASFILADAQRHEFAAASFDTIVSRFGVMFFEDPVAAFGNLRRAARIDANLRMIVFRRAPENPFMTTAERAAAPLLSKLPARKPDGPGQFAFADPRHVHTILDASGWADVRAEAIDVECKFPEEDLDFYITRLGPVGLALQDADEETRARVIPVVRGAFRPYVHAREVRFTGACWMVSARAASS